MHCCTTRSQLSRIVAYLFCVGASAAAADLSYHSMAARYVPIPVINFLSELYYIYIYIYKIFLF